MLPDIWGEDMWNCFHRIAYDYPDNPTLENREHYRNFYEGLQYVLPCSGCRTNFSIHLEELPLTDEVLANRNNLLQWTIKIHNLVNSSLGKPVLTDAEAMDKINGLVNPIDPNKKMNWLYFIIIIIVAIILICLIFYYINSRY